MSGVTTAAHLGQDTAAEITPARDYSDFRYGLTVFEYERIVERIGLDAEQEAIADALHAELRRERFEAEADYLEARADLEAWRLSMRDGTGPENRKERLRLYTAIVKRLNTHFYQFIECDIERAEAFLDDLRLVLRPDQVEGFDAALRWRIRHRQLRWGALPYTRVDLIEIVERMDEAGELVVDRERFGESAEEFIAAALKRYEVELDGELRRLIAIEAGHPNGARAQGRGRPLRGFEDPDEEEKWKVQFGAAAVRLAELQRKHVGLVGYYLTLRSRERLVTLSREQAYPFAYGKTGPELLINRLLEPEKELTEFQRDDIVRLRREYQSERMRIADEWISAIDAVVAKNDIAVINSRLLVEGYPLTAIDPEAQAVLKVRSRWSRMHIEWAQRIWKYASVSGLVESENPMPRYYGYAYVSRSASANLEASQNDTGQQK